MVFLVQINERRSKRIGANIATIRSVYEAFKNGSGAIIAEVPRITKIFIIFEPTTFQIAISGFHLLAAIIEVASSGILVPIATTVSPIIACDNQKNFAIFTAPSTRIFHPINNTSIPPAIHKVAFHGDMIFSTFSLSSGIKLLCFTE